MGIVRSFPVTDRHGDEFILYEFHDRRFLKRVRRMKLCTGELVEERDGTLIVAATGERLELVMGRLVSGSERPCDALLRQVGE